MLQNSVLLVMVPVVIALDLNCIMLNVTFLLVLNDVIHLLVDAPKEQEKNLMVRVQKNGKSKGKD